MPGGEVGEAADDRWLVTPVRSGGGATAAELLQAAHLDLLGLLCDLVTASAVTVPGDEPCPVAAVRRGHRAGEPWVRFVVAARAHRTDVVGDVARAADAVSAAAVALRPGSVGVGTSRVCTGDHLATWARHFAACADDLPRRWVPDGGVGGAPSRGVDLRVAP